MVLTCVGGCSEVRKGGVVNDGGRVITCNPYPWARVQVYVGTGLGGPKNTRGLPVTNPSCTWVCHFLVCVVRLQS